MNREQFRAILDHQPPENLASFMEYFGECLTRMTGNYTSLNTKIPIDRRTLNVTGVEQALAAYCWPAKTGQLPPDPTTQHILEYEESFEALSRYRQGIQTAISNGNNNDVIEWARLILKWGMGARGRAAMEFLEAQHDIAAYLHDIDLMSNLDGDTDNINSQEVRACNSGLSKIHSLASTSGLVIYDSRVAFALGECINGWAMTTGLNELPNALRFMQAGRKTSDPANRQIPQKPRGHNAGLSHPSESRDHRWLENQMRASWLFEAALENNPTLWGDTAMHVKMHNLEAAFFMLGAYAESISLPAAA